MIRALPCALLVLIVGCNKPINYLYLQPAPLRTLESQAPGQINGTITDALDGSALLGVTVTVHSASGLGQFVRTTQSLDDGTYSVSGLAPGNYLLDYTLVGFVPVTEVPVTVLIDQLTTQDETMTPTLASGQFRIVINWCDESECLAVNAVRDVDSYLHIPGEDPIHPIGYMNLNDNMGATLDHDDTQYSGPETVTISNLLVGEYIYYVNNYNMRSDPGALGRSNVVVHVYQGNQLIRVYNVPPGTGITYEVFHIVNGSIVDVQQYNDALPTY